MNLKNIRESDADFHLLETTGRTQTATIRLAPEESTSDDFSHHPHSDQTVLMLEGELHAEVGEETATLQSGSCVIIPAGVKHRLTNKSECPAFAFTCYAPPAYETGDPT